MIDKKLFSCDPGETTGMAFYNPYSMPNYWTDEAKSFDEVISIVLEFKPDVIVVERFATSGRISKYGLHTTELVGGLYALCVEHGWNFVRQTPQSRRSFLVDANEHDAPSLHGRSTHRGRHERDAFAHLLEYIWKVENGRD